VTETINRARVILETFESNQDDLARRMTHGARFVEYLPRLPAGAEPDTVRVAFHHEAKVRNGKTVEAIVGTWRGASHTCGVLR
jgi:hypothetical protein